MKKDKLFVVEGTHDEAVLQQCLPGIKTVSVGGSQIKKDVLDFLINNQDKFEIILLLDPDHAGESIRKRISRKLENPKHIFFDQNISFSKNRKKIGIEHVDYQLIKEMIAHEVNEKISVTDVSMSTLVDLGLTGSAGAIELRKVITDHFHIGHCNAKILLQRITWLGLKKEDLLRVINDTSS